MASEAISEQLVSTLFWGSMPLDLPRYYMLYVYVDTWTKLPSNSLLLPYKNRQLSCIYIALMLQLFYCSQKYEVQTSQPANFRRLKQQVKVTLIMQHLCWLPTVTAITYSRFTWKHHMDDKPDARWKISYILHRNHLYNLL